MNIFGMKKGGLTAVLVVAGCLCLTGCNIFGSGAPEADVDRPVTLHPETDMFSNGNLRSYQISEGIMRVGKDTSFTNRFLEISRLGDTVLGGATIPRVEIGTSPAPAAALALLGLNPTRVFFDSINIPDPGPALRFPDTPHVGWSLDTTVGDLRHVRRLTGARDVKAAGQRHDCWVFQDSTYWGSTAVSTGTYWVGAKGVVLHRQEWAAYAPSGITGGVFWRETRAAN